MLCALALEDHGVKPGAGKVPQEAATASAKDLMDDKSLGRVVVKFAV